MDIFEIDGAKYLSKDDMIVRWLRDGQGRVFEGETLEWIHKILQERPDGVFIDVGASTGWYSVRVALLGRLVVAIEPNSVVYARLLKNIALNDCSDLIVPHPFAASDVTGEIDLCYNPLVPLTSGASLDPKIRSRANISRMSVSQRLVDDIVGSVPVDIIKIDVEGYELPVLRGAQKTIDAWRPALVLEANDDFALEALRDWMFENNYDFRRADERNLLCLPMS